MEEKREILTIKKLYELACDGGFENALMGWKNDYCNDLEGWLKKEDFCFVDSINLFGVDIKFQAVVLNLDEVN